VRHRQTTAPAAPTRLATTRLRHRVLAVLADALPSERRHAQQLEHDARTLLRRVEVPLGDECCRRRARLAASRVARAAAAAAAGRAAAGRAAAAGAQRGGDASARDARELGLSSTRWS